MRLFSGVCVSLGVLAVTTGIQVAVMNGSCAIVIDAGKTSTIAQNIFSLHQCRHSDDKLKSN